MGYRKFSADQLFTGYELLDNCTLVVNENGIVEELLTGLNNNDDTEILKGTICPGFVNAHCHLELSHMKGRIPPGSGLVDFVFNVIKDRHTEKETILEAIADGEDEMIKNGIVAVGDICNNPLTLIQKLQKNLHYHNFIEASGFVPSVVQERFMKSVDLFNVYAELYRDPQASNSLAPHAPYSVAFDLLQKITAFPGNSILTMHNQESEDENALFKNKQGDFIRLYEKMNIDHTFFIPQGKSSLQSCLPYFFPQQTLILVHNVATSEDDLKFISENETPRLFFCLCPNANLYITGQLPPVDLLLKYKCELVLGTDSLASNSSLSILAEINTLKKHFPHLTIELLLKWATINGATALNIDDRFGSFEKGKQPGILLIDPSFSSAERLL
ncbi:MAG TPA: amidohydrolase family protein [Chitinophagaceae bacterium]